MNTIIFMIETVARRLQEMVDEVIFVATKNEAFRGRGNADYIGSADIEDIIAVIDGRPELAGEIEASKPELRDYVRRCFREFLDSDDFRTAVLGYVPRDPIGQRRYQTILGRIETIVSQET